MDQGSYRVIFAPRAIQDLEDAVTFIAANDAQAAERLGNALIDQAKILTTFPELGRRVPEFQDGSREIVFRSYRIIYRVDRGRKMIEIARFWHVTRGTPEV